MVYTFQVAYQFNCLHLISYRKLAVHVFDCLRLCRAVTQRHWCQLQGHHENDSMYHVPNFKGSPVSPFL